MSEKDLCDECLKFSKDNKLEIFPDTHCHHEPKEKEKCWCDLPKEERYTVVQGHFASFCLECGKPLKGAKP